MTIYENDFSKHNGKINSGRIFLIFRSIVSQLGKENEKFIYGCIKEGARAWEFEEAIEWLVSASAPCLYPTATMILALNAPHFCGI